MDSYAVAAAVAGVDPSQLLSVLQQQQQQHHSLNGVVNGMNGVNGGTEKCLVCSSPQSASPHFGTVSCLACAAFFRRTVALNITFHCKLNNNCNINYQLRMICRACRYDKCIKAGMKRHCVQKRRPSKKVKEESEEPCSSLLSPLKNELFNSTVKMEPFSPGSMLIMRREKEDSPSDEENDRLNGEELVQQPHSSSVDSYTDDDPSAPSTSFANSTTIESPLRPSSSRLAMSGMALLMHFVREEGRAMDRRRMMFSTKPLEALSNTPGSIPYERDSLTAHSLKAQVENVKFDHLLGYEYCMNMPGIQFLAHKERIMLYRICALSFSVTDIGFISAQLMRDGEEILIFTDGTYSTCGQNDFSVGWENEEIITMEDKKKLFLDFNRRFYAEIIKPMKLSRMDKVEHAALKALCCWKLGYYEYTNLMREMAREVELGIFEGLNEYYENRPDRDIRLGNLVLLMGNLFEMFQLVTDMYKQLDFFNLLKVDSITKALLCL